MLAALQEAERRNVPVLLQLLMWYLLFADWLPPLLEAPSLAGLFYLSKAGFSFPIPEWTFGVALATGIGVFILLAIVGNWLYYACFESSTWQGTPGKKVLNIAVTDMSGARISFGRASGRFFAKFITRLIPLGIGFILAGITERKQALHDMIASTLVLRR